MISAENLLSTHRLFSFSFFFTEDKKDIYIICEDIKYVCLNSMQHVLAHF